MHEITAVHGESILVDDEDSLLLSTKKWRVDYRKDKNGTTWPSTVREARVNGRSIHSFLLIALPGFLIDHINGDPLDNRRSNLRITDHKRNMWNRRVSYNSRSGYKGVYPNTGKNSGARMPWTARITTNGKRTHIGIFKTAFEAHLAYIAAEEKARGEFSTQPDRQNISNCHSLLVTIPTKICALPGCSIVFPVRFTGAHGKTGGFCCQEHRILGKKLRDWKRSPTHRLECPA